MNIHAHGDVLRRREEIVTIVREQTVHSQDELLQALRRRGFRVIQPTLSRDIAAIGLVKTPAGYVVPEALANVTPIARFSALDRFETAVDEYVLTAVAGGRLVAIKTGPGNATPGALARHAPRRGPPSRWLSPSTLRASTASSARSAATTRSSWPCPTTAPPRPWSDASTSSSAVPPDAPHAERAA